MEKATVRNTRFRDLSEIRIKVRFVRINLGIEKMLFTHQNQQRRPTPISATKKLLEKQNGANEDVLNVATLSA